jgi:hypothetical protein
LTAAISVFSAAFFLPVAAAARRWSVASSFVRPARNVVQVALVALVALAPKQATVAGLQRLPLAAPVRRMRWRAAGDEPVAAPLH